MKTKKSAHPMFFPATDSNREFKDCHLQPQFLHRSLQNSQITFLSGPS